MGDHLQKFILVGSCPNWVNARTRKKRVGFTFRHLLPALLNDQLIEPELLSCTLQHPFLDTTLGDEPEDEHLFCLADSMGAVHCLEVGLWVPVHLLDQKPQRMSVPLPVTVIKDDNISARQVDTQAAGASGKKEDESVAPFLVVFINGQNAIFVGGAAIDPAVL